MARQVNGAQFSIQMSLAAAKDADLVVTLKDTHLQDPPYTLEAYSQRKSLWTYVFPPEVDFAAGHEPLALSRDGQVLCVLMYRRSTQSSSLYILDGWSGTILREVVYSEPGDLAAQYVEISGDGSLCVPSVSITTHLVATSTGEELYRLRDGNGAWAATSESADRVAFSSLVNLRLLTRTENGYQDDLLFQNPAGSYLHKVALSRDGSTVAVVSARTDQLQNTVRIFDSETRQLIGMYQTTGTGQLNDTPTRAVFSDDGSILAVGFWGTEFHDHPEVLVFDRTAAVLGGVSLPGSVFGIDISGDGRYVLSASRQVHGQYFTRAGSDVTLFQVE